MTNRDVLWDRATRVHSNRDYATAVRLWREYLAKFGWFRSAAFNLAIAETHSGSTGTALDLMDRVIAERMDAASLHVRSVILSGLGRHDEAYREIHRAINMENISLVRSGLAEILLNMGRSKQAETEFRRAHRMAVNAHEEAIAVAGLAHLLMADQRWDEAIVLLLPVAQGETGETHEAQFQLGRAYYMKWLQTPRSPDDPLLDTALRWFEAAQQSMPSDARPWTAVGLVHLGFHRGDAATASLKRGLALGDEANFVRMRLAEAAYIVSDYENALTNARVATEGQYTREEAWEYVALAATQLDMNQTGTLIRQASDELPNSPQVANALGALLAHEESHNLADYWLDVSRRWPHDPVIQTNAVVVLLGKGDVAGAGEALLASDSIERTAGDPNVYVDASLRAAIIAGDEVEARNLLASAAQFYSIEGINPVSELWKPIQDYFVQLNAARFEERISAMFARDWNVRTAVRPDYLEGKEIDVECTRDGFLNLVEAKFRIAMQPLVRDEVVRLARKVETARVNNPGIAVCGTLVSNAHSVDDDAWQAAIEYEIVLLRCDVPKNWFRNPRWDIVGAKPYVPSN